MRRPWVRQIVCHQAEPIGRLLMCENMDLAQNVSLVVQIYWPAFNALRDCRTTAPSHFRGALPDANFFDRQRGDSPPPCSNARRRTGEVEARLTGANISAAAFPGTAEMGGQAEIPLSAVRTFATAPSTSLNLSSPKSPRRKVRKSAGSSHCSGTPAAI